MKKSRWVAGVFALCLSLGVATAVSALTYRVQWGDTLTRIAARFSTTVGDIVQANNIPNPDLIYVGQTLDIPTAGEDPTPAPPSTPPPPGGGNTYVVQQGDTLFAIARRFGVTVSAIAQANNISNVNYIWVGQVLTIPGGSDTPPTVPPGAGGDFELGGQANDLANKERMQFAGMTWVKIQYKWSAGDAPAVVAPAIGDAHENSFKILLSITGADPYPAPGSIDFISFIDFIKGVAALGPDAIEVWNEMNINFEWPAGEISPSSYVYNMLAPAYTAVKAADPSVLVISGALAPTGFDDGQNAWADDRYLAGMQAAGAVNYMDCIGAHHNAGATSPTVTTGHPGGAHYSWYFPSTLDLYYNVFGGAKKVCFTEMGYLSGEGFPGLPPDFWWASDTSAAEQAEWLADAARFAAAGGKIHLLIIYNVDFTRYDPDGDPQAGYAIIRPDDSCPACATLHDLDLDPSG